MRVALYCRVSTEEQAQHGLSIDAQLASLRQWAADNGHTIAGEYLELGVSGRRPPSKRPELQRLLDDLLPAHIELIAFTKLDRWTRNIKGYYDVQERLDRCRVSWTATQEDYETVTAGGRFKVNIMLSVAENEADRTSERIKAVFERKVEQGECINPSGLPLGYTCIGKRVVQDENAPAARAVFEHYAAHGNKMGARNMLQTEFHIDLPVLSVDHMLHNPLYTGEYRGNREYCEPIISRELFDRIQDDLARRHTRKTPSGRTYLFTGLLVCGECGRRMCSGARTRKHCVTVYYRCPGNYMMKLCENRHNTREALIETYLLDHLEEQLRDAESEYEQRPKVKRPTINRAAVQKKLDRLKDLYVDGLITKEQYRADHDKYTAQLAQPSDTPPRFTAIRHLIGANFREDYTALTQDQKKTFWRSVLDHIVIDKDSNLFFYFR